jgi:serine/threonine protein kinase
MTHSVCNPVFRAPEVDYGIGYDMKMDIWSLGMVMLEAQHGHVEVERFWRNNFSTNYKKITKYNNALDYIFILDPDLRPSASDLLFYSQGKNKPYTAKNEFSIDNDHKKFIEKYKGKFETYPIGNEIFESAPRGRELDDEYYDNTNYHIDYEKSGWFALPKKRLIF